jgi:hypothetical protein
MRISDFVELLDDLFLPEDKKRIMDKAIIEIDGNEGPANKGFKDHMLDIVDLFIEKSKEKVADLTVEGILKLIAKFGLALMV